MSSALRPDGAPFALYRKPDRSWDEFVVRLRAEGGPVTLQADASFARSFGVRRWLVGLRAADGAPAWCAPIEVGWSRTAPGSRILRVPRLGHGVPAGAEPAVSSALAAVARGARGLRMHAEVYAPDPDQRQRLISALHDRGFQDMPLGRSYERTVLIDLRPTETELLASFHRTCRSNIRALEKYQLACRPVSEPSMSPRMNALLHEAMARTGGRAESLNWPAWMAFIRSHPDLACLVGVYRTDREGPEALVGYVLGCRHGDILEYSIAASARLSDLRAPLLYAPTWQLMRWAREQGARLFDFGGVTMGSRESADALGGISEFKRYFSTNVVDVGRELVFEPSPLRSFVASGVSAMIDGARAVVSRRRPRRPSGEGTGR